MPYNSTSLFGQELTIGSIKYITDNSSQYIFFSTMQLNYLGTLQNNTLLQMWMSYKSWDNTTSSATPNSFLNL